MAKRKTIFLCSECGADHSKWQGQCSECGNWNTVSETFLTEPAAATAARPGYSGYAGNQPAQVQKLSEIEPEQLPRISSTIGEFDRVLGGGLVPGSAILIGGHPGAGKSTLLLQVMCHLSQSMAALYVTGEESLHQVAMRAERLGLKGENLQMLAETSVEAIVQHAEQHKPAVLVIDSIQVVHRSEIQSAPGSVSQVRESAAYLTRYAKQSNTILVLVGHVTKDGSLAGPKVLEHMIDCSVMLESSDDSRFRMLRAQKNRFGAVNELGVFAMLDSGLKEVKNPSSIFLNRQQEITPGSLVMAAWEGSRPLLVEIQALVAESNFGNPRRIAVGLDQNRLAMLLAVLQRHGGIVLGDQDIFTNVVGGVKISETSADLALVLAMISSFRNQSLPENLIVFGELGLSGEIRPVPSGQERLREAAKHGFTRAIVPEANLPQQHIKGIEAVGVTRINDALELIQ